jgi:hypothetical protein
MLSKLFVSLLLVTATTVAVPAEIQSGSWPDGTSLAWQCQKGSQGVVKFIFVTPDGKTYPGMLSCGSSV